MLKMKNSFKLLSSVLFVFLFLGSISNSFANVVSDTYHDAKKGAKNVYHKAKKGGKHFIDDEARGLKNIVKFEGKILKTEYDLAKFLASRPNYVVTEYVLHNRSRPPKRADLVISKLFLDKNGYVIVTIKNIGQGYLIVRPRHKSVNLYFKLNGRDYGGVTNRVFDPRNRLIKPRGKVTYRTDLKINKKTKVTAIIDDLNSVIESNEKNNVNIQVLPHATYASVKPETKRRATQTSGKRTHRKNHDSAKTLTVKEVKTRAIIKPDLHIEKLFLSRDCKVIVTVKNIGRGSLNDSVWTDKSPQSPSIYLLRNGKKWGGATIAGFDKRKRLQKSGGKINFVSNLKVNGTTSITAIVDLTKQVNESNENNNELTQSLRCDR